MRPSKLSENMKGTSHLVDFSVPTDNRVYMKEKQTNQQNTWTLLRAENLVNINVTVGPIVVDKLRTVLSRLVKYWKTRDKRKETGYIEHSNVVCIA